MEGYGVQNKITHDELWGFQGYFILTEKESRKQKGFWWLILVVGYWAIWLVRNDYVFDKCMLS